MEKGYLTEKEQSLLDDKNEELQQVFEESKEKARDIIENVMNHLPEGVANGIVILPQFVPWNDVVCEDPDAKFVVFPSNRGGYNLQAVPPTPESFEQRIPLPEAWLENKPKGATFVHQGRFFAAFDTKDHAIGAADEIMHYYNERKRDVLENIYEGSSLEDVPAEYKKDIDVVIAAIHNDPSELQYASDFLKEHPEVLEAVKNAHEGPDDNSKHKFDNIDR